MTPFFRAAARALRKNSCATYQSNLCGGRKVFAYPHVLIHYGTDPVTILNIMATPIDRGEVVLHMDVLKVPAIAQKHVNGLIPPAARNLSEEMQPARVE